MKSRQNIRLRDLSLLNPPLERVSSCGSLRQVSGRSKEQAEEPHHDCGLQAPAKRMMIRSLIWTRVEVAFVETPAPIKDRGAGDGSEDADGSSRRKSSDLNCKQRSKSAQ
jgi:hypothetical protein